MGIRGHARKSTAAKRLNRQARTRILNRRGERKLEKQTRAASNLAAKFREQPERANRIIESRRRVTASPQKKTTVIRGPKDVESSWVKSIAYLRHGRRNGVGVEFLSGAQVFYQNTTIKDYEYLRDAGSKGKAIWRRFYELPYELLN